ncbi:MAG: 3-hydroxyacyl-ACP dehydratase FabZ [Candidatus Competibacteraceae bacterium]|nr:3-hydroxyacyl-ACP dehydratase FabZ [Candidatus Competibacteraceae bacterium]MCB1814227.1 3-hydroxyacyl-ACP dehydratase FabZ [Candidatus Competibacteraceae bacterium]
MNTEKKLDIGQVLQYLPHRYPFLLVDRVLDYVPDESLLGLKNITYNEPFFTGHFPQRPIMPGVLIIEALAQATGILAFVSGEDKTDGEMFYLVGVDNARFKQPVEPGDQLLLDVQIRRIKRGIGMFTGVARVDDKIVASAELMCARRGINI